MNPETNIARFGVLALLLAVCSFAPGCGNKNQLSGLVPCHGTVLWNGQPVEGARVGFIPKSDPNGRSAFGLTDAKGEFKMTTLDTDDGAAPGEYFVTIIKRTTIRDVSTTYHIPMRYSDAKTSGMTIEVPSRGNKNISLEMEGEIPSAPIPLRR